jgi:nicotinamide-nucleotide amidase
MQSLLPKAEAAAALLKARGDTIAIAESSTGGLISAALLSVPGASAYFLGGGVIYTRKAGQEFLQISGEAVKGLRSTTEPYALLSARTVRDKLGAVWGIGETGATGPAANRFGDLGRSAIAVTGPRERTIAVDTGIADRIGNMRAFSAAALDLLIACLEDAGATS